MCYYSSVVASVVEYNMESFEEFVIRIKNSFFIGSYVDCFFSMSNAGQRFAILITKVCFFDFFLCVSFKRLAHIQLTFRVYYRMR